MRSQIIRKGRPDDVTHFTKLILIAGKLLNVLYGKKSKQLMEYLYCQPKNIYSYEHTFFAEVNGKVGGMVLGYSKEIIQQEQQRTRELMIYILKLGYLVRMKNLIKVHRYLGTPDINEYFISHIANYPEFRNLGIGKNLINMAVNEALRIGKQKVGLDVIRKNDNAIAFYEKYGFKKVYDYPPFLIKGQNYEYVKMELPIIR